MAGSVRVKQSDLQNAVDRINRVHRAQIKIDWAYNKPRITTEDDLKFLSPRVTRHECLMWLLGFESALEEKETQLR